MTTVIRGRLDNLRSIRAAQRLATLQREAGRAELDKLQVRRLRELVGHARSHSPYYRDRLREVDLDAPDLLERLPVLDKATMVARLPEILTVPRLREIDLAAHVDQLSGDELLLGEYRVMASGGTSGLRGLYVYDRSGWVEVAAGMGAAALLLGLPPRLPRTRAATIWAAGPAHMTARIAMSFRSPAYKRLGLSAMAPIPELVEQLNAFQPQWLSSYPSIAALLADEQRAGRLRISPRVVMTTSEECTRGMRARMAEAWGTEPFNTYAATEAGGMALECGAHGGMHVLESQVILEVVDDDGRRVPDGQPGTRVLVTNLFNRVQPLIRFELTDIVTMAAGPCPCGRPTRRISAIDGRSDDIIWLAADGGQLAPVHPNHFAEAIESVAGVSAYRVTETEAGVDVAVVVPSDRVADLVAERVGANLAVLGVLRPPLRVHRVDQIPRPSGASGKFKLVQARRHGPADVSAGGG